MKIQLLSDLHVEFWPTKASVWHAMHEELFTDADVLILAGDINAGRANTKATLKKFASHYKHVIYVKGNHEEYAGMHNSFKRDFVVPGNVYFLDPGHITIDGVHFIGAMLATNFGEDPLAESIAAYGISDFGRVGGLTTNLYKKQYYDDLAYIQSAYALLDGPKVIVTHWLPAIECISPRFLDGGPINKYFANNLGEYIAMLSNTTWMFGHTHDSINMMIGDTPMHCNPYGYFGNELNANFIKHYVIEL